MKKEQNKKLYSQPFYLGKIPESEINEADREGLKVCLDCGKGWYYYVRPIPGCEGWHMHQCIQCGSYLRIPEILTRLYPVQWHFMLS